MRLITYLKKNSWEENLDKNIPKDIMEEINSLEDFSVVSSCNGHNKKGPSIFFEIRRKQLEMMIFENIRWIYDDITKSLNSILDNTHSKWICWLNPSEFLYDSDLRV